MRTKKYLEPSESLEEVSWEVLRLPERLERRLREIAGRPFGPFWPFGFFGCGSAYGESCAFCLDTINGKEHTEVFGELLKSDDLCSTELNGKFHRLAQLL